MGNASENLILRVEHLSRMVNSHVLVDDVSVTVPRGEVLAIVGPSGSGKSSFLRMLNRLDEPNKGRVYLEGQDTAELPPRVLRQRMGMVMQAANLFPGTVADNIRFGPAQRGETIDDERLDAILTRVGLGGYETRDVNNLSGGEAQRVSVARTLANQPVVLLLDEPTSALDDAAEKEVEDLLCRLKDEWHLTCLMVTHDMRQASRVADRVMVMEAGRMAKIGAVEEVLSA